MGKSSVLTLTLNAELTAAIREALTTEASMRRFKANDIRWYRAREQLRYLREEIGTMVIWQVQEAR